jgi:hypothetical protein
MQPAADVGTQRNPAMQPAADVGTQRNPAIYARIID